ncbi:MAG: DNA mismatch repair endonuclease MutL [Planctomycetota bacterium]|jgi:DNA mismatch repair protein MutL
MGQIVVLDRNMINMIAAGEVIERPASVVKELTENSIDAGATKITVSIEDGGRKLISVSDNGCGMNAEDLACAFEPHSTSKIKTTRDLQAISTLGFRGEALASIASVAQIKAVSRTQDSTGGNSIEIDCGTKSNISPCSADYGTTIQVRDLFYKMPARRKFLRTANTEMGHITEYFTRIALANCDLDMTLIHNARELYRLVAKQGLSRRIAQLFSSEIAENLIETESNEKGLHIFALMGKPRISRTNNKFQYVFLNGRFIRDKFIAHAIKEAYRTNLEPNRYPVIFLFIEIPCDHYDVNVHPTKIEVRFYNSNLVHSQILGCLREKLLASDFQQQAKLPPTDPARSEHDRKIADAMAEFFKKHRPIQTQQQQFGFRSTTRTTAIADTAGLAPAAKDTINAIQIHDSFVVAQTEDGFIIIDQHALHERIMYEDLRRRIRTSNLESQKLLIPESFELTDAQAETIKANAELIEKLGIELAPFGPKAMAIQAFPTLLAKAAPVNFVQDLIDLLTDKGQTLDAESLLDEVLNMAACKAAIKAGQKLSDGEIEQLLADRQIVESAARCPHGRPTTIKFSVAELEKQFKRT